VIARLEGSTPSQLSILSMLFQTNRTLFGAHGKRSTKGGSELASGIFHGERRRGGGGVTTNYCCCCCCVGIGIVTESAHSIEKESVFQDY
jgi:hypothetical protein